MARPKKRKAPPSESVPSPPVQKTKIRGRPPKRATREAVTTQVNPTLTDKESDDTKALPRHSKTEVEVPQGNPRSTRSTLNGRASSPKATGEVTEARIKSSRAGKQVMSGSKKVIGKGGSRAAPGSKIATRVENLEPPDTPAPFRSSNSRQKLVVAENSDDEADDDDRQYWLMKAEPESRIEKGKDVRFSIDDLKAARSPEPWDGIRNPVARNNMRAMLKGDLAFFYHSNCKKPGIVGTMEVVQEHSVDESAFDPKHPYYDEKSSREKPRWCVVHVEFRSKFADQVSLKELQRYSKVGGILESLQTLKQKRLSVSKVSKQEWDFIMSLVEVEDTADKMALKDSEHGTVDDKAGRAESDKSLTAAERDKDEIISSAHDGTTDGKPIAKDLKGFEPLNEMSNGMDALETPVTEEDLKEFDD